MRSHRADAPDISPVEAGLISEAHRTSGQNGGVAVGTAISLFSGAGGLDLGADQAGFQTRVAVEWDHDAADTMEKNAPRHLPGLESVLRADLYPLASEAGRGLHTRDLDPPR